MPFNNNYFFAFLIILYRALKKKFGYILIENLVDFGRISMFVGKWTN